MKHLIVACCLWAGWPNNYNVLPNVNKEFRCLFWNVAFHESIVQKPLKGAWDLGLSHLVSKYYEISKTANRLLIKFAEMDLFVIISVHIEITNMCFFTAGFNKRHWVHIEITGISSLAKFKTLILKVSLSLKIRLLCIESQWDTTELSFELFLSQSHF